MTGSHSRHDNTAYFCSLSSVNAVNRRSKSGSSIRFDEQALSDSSRLASSCKLGWMTASFLNVEVRASREEVNRSDVKSSERSSSALKNSTEEGFDSSVSKGNIWPRVLRSLTFVFSDMILLGLRSKGERRPRPSRILGITSDLRKYAYLMLSDRT